MKQRWTRRRTADGATLDELLEPYVARQVPRRMTQRRAARALAPKADWAAVLDATFPEPKR